MAGERKYYVFCEDKCKFEAMTKEQTINAIAEATGRTPESIETNEAFISMIKEQNANKNLKFWIGTTAQFQALQQKDNDTMYILTDDDSADSWDEIAEDVEELKDKIEKLTDSGEIKAKKSEQADNATSATKAQYASDDKTKGTIEDRLTRLGFKEGEIATQSSDFVQIKENYLKRQGNYVLGHFKATTGVLSETTKQFVLGKIPKLFDAKEGINAYMRRETSGFSTSKVGVLSLVVESTQESDYPLVLKTGEITLSEYYSMEVDIWFGYEAKPL